MQVKDAGGLTETFDAVIAVEDVNEPPTIADTVAEIDENAPANTGVSWKAPNAPPKGTDVDAGQTAYSQIRFRENDSRCQAFAVPY